MNEEYIINECEMAGWVAWLKDGKIHSGLVYNIEAIEGIDIKDFVKGFKHCFGETQREVEENLRG